MTGREKLFCDEFIICQNAALAARKAGYSQSTAERASDWINVNGQNKPSSKYKAELRAYIDKRMAEKQSELIASQNEVLEYITSVLRGNSMSTELVVEGVGNGYSTARTIEKAPSEKDRLKAAELLGKCFGMFTDKLNVDVTKPVIISGADQLED